MSSRLLTLDLRLNSDFRLKTLDLLAGQIRVDFSVSSNSPNSGKLSKIWLNQKRNYQRPEPINAVVHMLYLVPVLRFAVTARKLSHHILFVPIVVGMLARLQDWLK